MIMHVDRWYDHPVERQNAQMKCQEPNSCAYLSKPDVWRGQPAVVRSAKRFQWRILPMELAVIRGMKAVYNAHQLSPVIFFFVEHVPRLMAILP